MLRTLLAAFALSACLAAPAAAAPANWLEPADLSKPGRDAHNPAVVMDAAGNTVAIWERQNTFNASFSLQISTRAPGGAFTAPVDFSPSSSTPQLAVTPSGEVVAAWKQFVNPLNTIQVATRAPGAAAFGPPVTAYTAAPSVQPQDLRLAAGPNGDIALVWTEIDPNSGLDKVTCEIHPVLGPLKCGNPAFVKATVRPAGGSFTAPQRISEPRGSGPDGETVEEKEEREKAESKLAASDAHPAIDAAGRAIFVWTFFDGTDYVIDSAVREGAAFGPPTQVSASGQDSAFADIEMDAAGNAIAVWNRLEGAARRVEAALRPPGGSFAGLGTLSPVGGTAEEPAIDVTDGGTATVVWRLTGFSETFLQATTRPPGGAFSAPLSLNSGKDNPLFPEIATNEAGDALVAWNGDNGGQEIIRAAVRQAGGGFSAPVAISQTSPDLFHPKPTMDAGGNATVVWTRDNGLHNIVQWTGYDAEPPELRNVSIPGSAMVGDTVQLSASSFDVWPVGAPSFDFGDGVQAAGNAVSHVYSAPGAYRVLVSATDAVGRTGTSAGTIQVKARNFFKLGKLKRNRKKGTATLAVTIPEPGALVASAKGVKKATVRSAKGATVRIPLKAAGRGLKRLNKKGKLKFRLKVTYAPVGGDPNTQQRRLRLDKKLP
jgi:hypothetical protein